MLRALNSPPHSNNLITIPLLFFIFIFSRFSGTAQSCTCSGGGLNLTGNSILLSDLVGGSQLPPSGSSIGCISVPANANLKIDINYIFSGTTFNMASNSRITVEPNIRLTLQSNCHLENCDDDPYGWVGIIVQSRAEIDMSDCILENGALRANNLSKIRLVDNIFRNAQSGLVINGYVSFIDFEDPDNFSGNYFYNHIYAIFMGHAGFFNIGDKNATSATVVNTIDTYGTDGAGVCMEECRNIGIYGLNVTGVFSTNNIYDERSMISIRNCANVTVKYCTITPFLGLTTYGIYCSNSFGVLDFSNNSITSASAGIYLERFGGDYNDLKKCTMKDNDLNSTRGIVIEDYTADEGTYYQIEENEIDFFPKRPYWFYPGGILLNRVNGRYDIYNNTVTRLSAGNDPTYPYGAELRCIGIDFCTGAGKVDYNTLGYDMPLANTGIGVSTSRNIKFTVNTLSGQVQDENRPGSHGIMITNCTGLNDQYTDAIEYLDSLTALVEAIQEAYPGATTNEKADLREDMADLGEEIIGVLYEMDTLHDQAATEFQQDLARLLAANDSLQTAEAWETNEKEINVLLFKYFGKMIDTFTNAEKQQIIELAEACPRYEGAGVYKARLLRGTFVDSTFAGYDENQCVPAEFKVSKVNSPVLVEGLSVIPNPASDRVLVRLGRTATLDDRIVLRDLTGRILLSTAVTHVSEISLPLTGIPSGLYLLTRQPAESAPVSVKLVISR